MTKYREIGGRLPARSVNSLRVHYKQLKSLVEQFTPDDVYFITHVANQQDSKLRALILEDEKKRWKRIGDLMGKSDRGCQKRATQLGLAK